MPRPGGNPRRVSDPSNDRQPNGAPSWKAVTSPGDHEDYPGQLLITRDTDTIVAWAGARDATPIVVGEPGGDRLDELALDLPGQAPRDAGRAVAWEQWLGTFRTADLRFVFQEHTSQGEVSTYYRLDPSSHEEGSGRARGG
jgi:hypothetical protein